jgi:hypothetical protein
MKPFLMWIAYHASFSLQLFRYKGLVLTSVGFVVYRFIFYRMRIISFVEKLFRNFVYLYYDAS